MGGSSGGGGHTPYEAPDSGRSKQRVRIVEVVSEGEVQGLVDGVKSVYLDNTPIQNQDGSYNFTNIHAEGRIGTQDQAVMTGFQATEKEVAVSTEIRKKTPLTHTITDPKVSRLRLTLGVSSLFEQKDNGDTYGSAVDFKITIGGNLYSLSIQGKYSSQYLRNLVIDHLPPVPFTVKVERVQEDSKSQRLQNKTLWASYTEIIDTEFAYPNTAVVGIKFDSEYFSNIPTRSYEVYGIKIKVPSNYNPETRTYGPLWDGTFKIAYSDNPALILMDVVTNKRYGLGQRLGEFGVDKWAIYQAAQYCDQMIPDGFGGIRPRFTCNVWMTEQRSAYDVINDLCSIFRAMPVWNGTELTVIMDRPSDPVWTYTNANVINGEFSRQYSAVKARHNAIQVEYQDAANNYEKTIEYVSNDDDIRKYGLNLKKVVAFGCTNRGQAYCTGRWILETERLETETVTFSVGAEGLMHIPGDIIQVSDNHYAGTEIGGRVVAVSGRNVTLDRDIRLDGNSYFSYINAEAKHSHIKISKVNGKVITLDREPVGLAEMGVWSLSTQKIRSRLYRAMTITENDNGSYTIVALQHEPQKEAIVDNGAVFEPVSTTAHLAPKVEHLDVDVGAGKARIGWQASSGIGTLTYDVRVLKSGKLYAFHKGLDNPELTLDDLPNGSYEIIIQAKNAKGQLISEKSKPFTVDRPPLPQNVQVVGGLSDISLSWGYVDDFTQTEIWASETDDLRTAKRVAKVLASFYAHTVGASQTRYYWLRHTRGQNVGDFAQQQGLRGETGVDVDAEMTVLKEKLSQPIIDQVFDVAAPARQLEMIKVVPNIVNKTQFLGHTLLKNQADSRLYKWNGRSYEFSTPSSEIDGKILPAQLADIPTSKLSGQISDAQIKALNINKVQGNLPTNRLTGQLTDSQIASLNVSKLAGSVPKAKLDTGFVAEVTKAKADLVKETNDRIAAVRAEAQARGAAISNVERSVQQANNALAEAKRNLTAKVDGLQVGGRNLILQSKTFLDNANVTLTSTDNHRTKGFKISSNVDLSTVRNFAFSCFIRHSANPQQVPKATGKSYYRIGAEIRVRYQDGSHQYFSCFRYGDRLGTTFEGIQHTIIQLPANKTLISIESCVIQIHGLNAPLLYVGNPKLEIGNVVTDWSPAPEDAETDISNVQANLTTYQSAQATADAAKAAQIAGMDARLGQAESQITRTEQTVATLNQTIAASLQNLQSRTQNTETSVNQLESTKASKTEVASIAQQNLQSVWRADAQNAVDALKIGGANLLVDSEYLTTARWGGSSRVASSQYGDRRLTQVFVAQAGTGHFGVTQGAQKATTRIRQGETYTLSLNAQGTVGFTRTGLNYVYLIREDGGNFRLPTLPLTASLSQRPKVTFTAPWTSNQVRLLIGANGTFEATDWFAFHSVKLERGNVATDWTPNIADSDTKLADVKAELNRLSQTVGNQNSAYVQDKQELTAKLATATASLSSTSEVVARLNGTVESLHTIKTEAISGGRTAFAGISLGANQEEGSVIVMADRFGVVKNAQDGSVKQTFVIENNQVAINGDLIANGAITTPKLAANSVTATAIQAGAIGTQQLAANAVVASKIAANSIAANHIQANAISAGKIAANAVQAGNIQAGAIRANHVAAGELTADKLAIGLGGNLLTNPIFATVGKNNHGYEAPIGWYHNKPTHITAEGRAEYRKAGGGDDWSITNGLDNENTLSFYTKMLTPRTGDILAWVYQDCSVVAGKWYMASCYMAAHRGQVNLVVEKIARTGLDYISLIGQSGLVRYEHANAHGRTLNSYKRVFVKFQAPDTGRIRFMIRSYSIKSQNTPYIFAMRPMLEECTEHTREPSPWQNAGVTSIHGGSIVTQSITAQQLSAGSVTTEKLVAGAVQASHIAANTIGAQHIQTHSLSADKLNIQSLSAVSSVLGAVRAGNITGSTINGNTITGGSISGTTISGTTITGGTIRGAHIEGVTVKAENIIGDVMRAYSVTYNNSSNSVSNYRLNLTIPATNRRRVAYLMPVILTSSGYRTIGAGERDEWQWSSTKSANVIINLNNRKVLSNQASGGNYSAALQGSFYIDSNTTANITIVINSTYQGLANGTQFVFFVANG